MAKYNHDRAAISIELLIALPIILMLVLGSVFLGFFLITQSALQSAANIGARSAIYFSGDYQEVRDDIIKEADARVIGNIENVTATISFEDDHGSVVYSSTFRLSDGPNAPGQPAPPGARIRIHLVYHDYNLSIPFVSQQTINITGTAFARNTVPR